MIENLLPTELRQGLTKTEQEILESLSKGDVVSTGWRYRQGEWSYDQWRNLYTARASFLQFLCINSDIAGEIHYSGIKIKGAWIDGCLDLQGAQLLHDLRLEECAIFGGIILSNATTRHVNLDGSFVRFLKGDELRAKGSISMKNVRVTEYISFYLSTIEGDLICTGANVGGIDSLALLADGITVKGNVLLNYNFRAEGSVRLSKARIKGQLDCSGGAFVNPGGYALSGDGINVEGDVLFREAFHAKGAVTLVGADIRGRLSCSGGKFENPGEIAIHGDGVLVKSSFLLSQGFKAHGEVRIFGATVGGNPDCISGLFKNLGGFALNAEQIGVRGSVFLANGFRAEGRVSLIGAQIGKFFSCVGAKLQGVIDLSHATATVLADDPQAWPGQGKVHLDGFQYVRIYDRSPTSAEERVVWLRKMPRFLPQPYEHLARVLEV